MLTGNDMVKSPNTSALSDLSSNVVQYHWRHKYTNTSSVPQHTSAHFEGT
jgi:hypothetical protein